MKEKCHWARWSNNVVPVFARGAWPWGGGIGWYSKWLGTFPNEVCVLGQDVACMVLVLGVLVPESQKSCGSDNKYADVGVKVSAGVGENVEGKCKRSLAGFGW